MSVMRTMCVLAVVSAVKVQRSRLAAHHVQPSEDEVSSDGAGGEMPTTANSTDSRNDTNASEPVEEGDFGNVTDDGANSSTENATLNATFAKTKANSTTENATLNGNIAKTEANSTTENATVNATPSKTEAKSTKENATLNATLSKTEAVPESDDDEFVTDDLAEATSTGDDAKSDAAKRLEAVQPRQKESDEDDEVEISSKDTRDPCITRMDQRAVAWWADTALAGTPCVFGVDPRDEAGHCIYETEFGSFGWCFTNRDKSAWGSCGENCPLFGPLKALSGKLEGVDEQVGDLLKKVKGLPMKDESAKAMDSSGSEVWPADDFAKPSENPSPPAEDGVLPADEDGELPEGPPAEDEISPAEEDASAEKRAPVEKTPFSRPEDLAFAARPARALRNARTPSRIPDSHSGYVLLQEAAPRAQGLAVDDDDDEAVCDLMP